MKNEKSKKVLHTKKGSRIKKDKPSNQELGDQTTVHIQDKQPVDLATTLVHIDGSPFYVISKDNDSFLVKSPIEGLSTKVNVEPTSRGIYDHNLDMGLIGLTPMDEFKTPKLLTELTPQPLISPTSPSIVEALLMRMEKRAKNSGKRKRFILLALLAVGFMYSWIPQGRTDIMLRGATDIIDPMVATTCIVNSAYYAQPMMKEVMDITPIPKAQQNFNAQWMSDTIGNMLTRWRPSPIINDIEPASDWFTNGITIIPTNFDPLPYAQRFIDELSDATKKVLYTVQETFERVPQQVVGRRTEEAVLRGLMDETSVLFTAPTIQEKKRVAEIYFNTQEYIKYAIHYTLKFSAEVTGQLKQFFILQVDNVILKSKSLNKLMMSIFVQLHENISRIFNFLNPYMGQIWQVIVPADVPEEYIIPLPNLQFSDKTYQLFNYLHQEINTFLQGMQNWTILPNLPIKEQIQYVTSLFNNTNQLVQTSYDLVTQTTQLSRNRKAGGNATLSKKLDFISGEMAGMCNQWSHVFEGFKTTQSIAEPSKTLVEKVLETVQPSPTKTTSWTPEVYTTLNQLHTYATADHLKTNPMPSFGQTEWIQDKLNKVHNYFNVPWEIWQERLLNTLERWAQQEQMEQEAIRAPMLVIMDAVQQAIRPAEVNRPLPARPVQPVPAVGLPVRPIRQLQYA